MKLFIQIFQFIIISDKKKPVRLGIIHFVVINYNISKLNVPTRKNVQVFPQKIKCFKGRIVVAQEVGCTDREIVKS